MAQVQLGQADIALLSNPGATRVLIPHLVSAPRRRSRVGTTVLFAGDDYPTPFRGTGRAMTLDLTARFGPTEHETMLDLVELLDVVAAEAPDSRLLLRTHYALAAGLDLAVAVVVFDVVDTPLGAGAFDVSFTATVVEHTFAV